MAHIESSDCFCQLFPTSASRHKRPSPPPPLLPLSSIPVWHLWSGYQVVAIVMSGRTCLAKQQRVKSACSRWCLMDSSKLQNILGCLFHRLGKIIHTTFPLIAARTFMWIVELHSVFRRSLGPFILTSLFHCFCFLSSYFLYFVALLLTIICSLSLR